MNNIYLRTILTSILLLCIHLTVLQAQAITELNSGWYCKNIGEVHGSGEQLTAGNLTDITEWMPAVVPGTVLTTLLQNKKVPDPFFGTNNESIEDIYDIGRDHYTYWFYNEFSIKNIEKNDQFWLKFRGINYSAEIFLNGKKLNPKTHFGMFLRQSYQATELVKKGINRLAVLVHPADPVGNPNRGQGGDGVIAKNVMHQYVAGWDWIQPVRDRNTGIWDKVWLEQTGSVDISNPHVVTLVPGDRLPGKDQAPATIQVSIELKNASSKIANGALQTDLEGHASGMDVQLMPFEKKVVSLPDIKVDHPKLWWPNGYGEQTLYDLKIKFTEGKTISDTETVRFGIREIQTEWNAKTRSRQIRVNGQKIFIKGGNWIISDAMLRFSRERYDAEIRMHRDMNLNCIRIWGGAITERPEFYAACDRYGLLVMQDFWISGDCNGRWLDRRKKDDQWTRRQYPDDDHLWLRSAADQVKMIRNHPSLAFWCGGNELGPPEDMLYALQDTLDRLDGTRWFVESSTSDSMSFNFIGGNGDGPYSIQETDVFFKERSFPFNSEIGSVGLPDLEGLKRFMPEEALVIPGRYTPEDGAQPNRWNSIHPVWRYHKFSGYRDQISRYGEPAGLKDFAFKAQLVNYDQYRALIEGFTSHMWEWYTGVIIWKTQNPWTALRGQMYDYYLDQNAGLFGLHHGSEAIHIFYDPVEKQVLISNNTFEPLRDVMIEVSCYDTEGKMDLIYQELVAIGPTTVRRYGSIERRIPESASREGVFMHMRLLDQDCLVLSENFYWLPNAEGQYPGLQKMAEANIQASASFTSDGAIMVKIENPLENPVSFFNRISVVHRETDQRLLPVFYSDNYVSIPPGRMHLVRIEGQSLDQHRDIHIKIEGWNTRPIELDITSPKIPSDQ